MKCEDKIRMLTTFARTNGMMTALACMEGATITKRMALTLDDQLDHMDEVLSDLTNEAVKDIEACIGIIRPYFPESDIEVEDLDTDQ